MPRQDMSAEIATTIDSIPDKGPKRMKLDLQDKLFGSPTALVVLLEPWLKVVNSARHLANDVGESVESLCRCCVGV